MMWSIVGLKRAFMASGFILSMPWEDHFTKSTLQRQERRDKHAIIDPALITSRLVGYCKSNKGNKTFFFFNSPLNGYKEIAVSSTTFNLLCLVYYLYGDLTQ